MVLTDERGLSDMDNTPPGGREPEPPASKQEERSPKKKKKRMDSSRSKSRGKSRKLSAKSSPAKATEIPDDEPLKLWTKRLLQPPFLPPTGATTYSPPPPRRRRDALTLGLQGSLTLVGSSSTGEASTSRKGFDPSENFDRGCEDQQKLACKEEHPLVAPDPSHLQQGLHSAEGFVLGRRRGAAEDQFIAGTRHMHTLGMIILPTRIYWVWEFPRSSFNSLVLNRYGGGNDHVSWHSDEEVVC
ncbi:hypothetical protein MLD38_009939 [Melastoma candidum]|uniref:Uncharacterized protein n=1 Tax=Melastoma candidum TaxID=119954 RepID=A0ACB9QXF4_9MYRT|nr:hypothetical protein MLD38_009939 [Melastoma candidum]